MDGCNLPADHPSHSKSGAVVILQRRGNTFVKQSRIPTGAIPEGVAFTGDGRYLLVQCHPDRQIRMYRVTDGKVEDTGQRIDLPGMPSSLAGAPDQKVNICDTPKFAKEISAMSESTPKGSSNHRSVDRRSFLKTLAATSAGALVAGAPKIASAKLPAAKITKVKIFEPPNRNPIFNQSNLVVLVETDTGLTGIGEGGSRDTLEQCASRLIGKNPFDIERCWNDMYRSFFYPPGREKIHALGALDIALWDLKGKALDVPVYDLIGGMAELLRVLQNHRRTWNGERTSPPCDGCRLPRLSNGCRQFARQQCV